MNYLRMDDSVAKEDFHVDPQQAWALSDQGTQQVVQWPIDPALLSPGEQVIDQISAPATPNEGGILSLARPSSCPITWTPQFEYSDPSKMWQPSPYTSPDWPWQEQHYRQENMSSYTSSPFGSPPPIVQAPASPALLITLPNLPVRNEVARQKGPGRPRKHPLPDPFAPKKSRGRPKGSRDSYKRLGKGEKTQMKANGVYEEEVRDRKTAKKAQP